MWKKNIWKAVQPQPTAVREKLVTKYDDLFSMMNQTPMKLINNKKVMTCEPVRLPG